MAYTRKVGEDDDIYTVKEFLECCDGGCFTDYDGYGYPAKDGMADPEKTIIPSELNIPKGATHIIWFNR